MPAANGIAATPISLSMRDLVRFFIDSEVILRGRAASVQAGAEACVMAKGDKFLYGRVIMAIDSNYTPNGIRVACQFHSPRRPYLPLK